MDRTKGIGGSDVHHIFSLEPYGCERQLWYEKKGVEPDFPFYGNKLTERGNLLEPVIADIYGKETHYIIKKSIDIRTHKMHNFVTGHYDRIIQKHHDDRNYGILEIKSVGRQRYYKIKAEGLPYSWILQLQHYLMISEYNTWGAFAIWWADNNEFIDFEVTADKELQETILNAEIEFWQMVQDGKTEPKLLDPSDKRCKTCPYRTKCQGQALIDSVDDFDDSEIETDTTLDELIVEYSSVNSDYKELKTRVEDIKGDIMSAMGDRAIVQTSDAKIHFKTQVSHRWNDKMLGEDHPELIEKYKTESVSRPLRIYIKK